MCHWAVSTWEDRYCPGGCGSKRHGDVEGELLILGEYSPDIHPPTDACSPLSHPPHSASTLSCFLFAIGERPSQVCQLSANRCVLWFEECLFVGNLQTFFCDAAKRQCHSALAASKNKYVDCWSVPLLWIQQWSSRASQHCVNEPQPTQSPIGFSALSLWKYPCKPFVSLCLWTKTFS